MKKSQPRTAVHRKDYAPYPWDLRSVSLHFSILDEHTEVSAELALRARDPDAQALLELHGEDLELLEISINDRDLAEGDYEVQAGCLRIAGAPSECLLRTRVRIHPAGNAALEGLYSSGAFLLTQCEPEGFRRITWFPDRPDVMTRYDVTIEADRQRYPVLLSNGNPTDRGEAGAGRHWQRWEDPFPKPCYLFALVAGDLAYVEDHFTTRSGRRVTLRVYVEQQNLDRCGHAMESLVNAMRWDEQRFNLEYDLDIYNIVATSAFNMGAMENKSLNIFNSKYVLARPDTATDMDYQGIEGVIGHEYFHNWTGNRVTCRDWFQLTLKEGLTVFRDEEFSADMQSRAVKRIQDIRELRLRQFPEDAGPMSHPIRPDHYMEINNFYTATVYQKGAAIIRLYHTLLGEEGFQAGMRLYFERHDGQAVTCDDFRAAMADATGVNLDAFGRWYSQSGTPEVTVRTEYDPAARSYTVHLSQATDATHDQKDKQALVIPFAIGLLTPGGEELELDCGDGAMPATTRVLRLEEQQASFVFHKVPVQPVPSLLRDFSAPVKVIYDYSEAELATLIAHDRDAFSRWEAAQRLAQAAILDTVDGLAQQRELSLNEALARAFRGLLEDQAADPGLLAEALALPEEDYLAEQMDEVDVDGIHAAREFVRAALADELADVLWSRFRELSDGAPYSKAPKAIARRSLRNACLAYLATGDAGRKAAREQLAACDNMTDTLACLRALVLNADPAAESALADFERRWGDDVLVMDKWFALQAMIPGHDAAHRVAGLMGHPAFNLRNPNKVRALLGVFSILNPIGFHAADGAGYRLVADQVIALDAFNSQMAARMVSAFNRWPRYDAQRRALMQAELRRIAAVDGLSNDVFEIVSNALD